MFDILEVWERNNSNDNMYKIFQMLDLKLADENKSFSIFLHFLTMIILVFNFTNFSSKLIMIHGQNV